MPHPHPQPGLPGANRPVGGGLSGLVGPGSVLSQRPATPVPANVDVPAALATPNVPLASPQAANRPVVDLGAAPIAQSLGAAPSIPAQPAAIAPVAPPGGGIAGNIRDLVGRAQAGQASQRSTAFGRQNTDGINPQSLF